MVDGGRDGLGADVDELTQTECDVLLHRPDRANVERVGARDRRRRGHIGARDPCELGAARDELAGRDGDVNDQSVSRRELE